MDESQTREFKKSLSDPHGIGEALCAFLNSGQPAELHIGISPRGKRVGIHVSDGTQQEIANIIKHIEPAPDIELRIDEVENGKSIITLKTLSNLESIPYVYKGRSFLRIGTTTTLMPQDKYHELLDMRRQIRVQWEQMPAHAQSIDDLDHDEIRRTLYDGAKNHRIPEIKDDPHEILSKLELIRNGKFTHAAYILFTKSARPHYPQCLTRIARFDGIKKTDPFIDERHIWGNAFHQLREAMVFIERHIPKSFQFQEGQLERIDVPLIPFTVLREALINALCHRDYSNHRCSIEIGLYDDRIEIWSPGGLPHGMTLELLQAQHPSLPRNDSIAHTFFRRGLIEQWGTGTLKMLEECKKAGLSAPVFTHHANHLLITFPVLLKSTSDKSVDSLSDRQQKILQLLLTHHKMTLKDLHREMGVSTRTLQRELKLLNSMQRVEQEGYGAGSAWKIQKNSAK